MVRFKTKNPNFGNILEGRKYWYILWSFEIFYEYMGYFMTFWYIFPAFGIMYLEKSGNPGTY
jgi:hypothetical protein